LIPVHCKEKRFFDGFQKGFLVVLRREPFNGFSVKPFLQGFLGNPCQKVSERVSKRFTGKPFTKGFRKGLISLKRTLEWVFYRTPIAGWETFYTIFLDMLSLRVRTESLLP